LAKKPLVESLSFFIAKGVSAYVETPFAFASSSSYSKILVAKE